MDGPPPCIETGSGQQAPLNIPHGLESGARGMYIQRKAWKPPSRTCATKERGFGFMERFQACRRPLARLGSEEGRKGGFECGEEKGRKLP